MTRTQARLRDLSTHWSAVQAMGAEDEAEAARAVEVFLRRYLHAMTRYLVESRRFNPHDADDVVQGFVADRILAKQILRQADASRGRLRGLLKVALIRYAINSKRRKQPLFVDDLDQTVDHRSGNSRIGSEVDSFDIVWAKEVITQAFEQTQRALETAGHESAWTIFELRVVRPLLSGTEAVPPQKLAEQLDLRDSTQVANLLVTAKRRFQRTLREVVGEYAGDSIGVEQEVADLRRILAQAVYKE